MLGSGQVQLAFIGGLGPTELIVIFLIVLLVFGAKRIPEIAQGLGKGIMEFKKAARDITKEIDIEDDITHNVRNELKGNRPADTSSPSQNNDSKQG